MQVFSLWVSSIGCLDFFSGKKHPPNQTSMILFCVWLVLYLYYLCTILSILFYAVSTVLCNI